jgi:hypothetical protein
MKPPIALALLMVLTGSVASGETVAFPECLALALDRDPQMAEVRILVFQARVDGKLFDAGYGTRVTASSFPAYAYAWDPSPFDSNTLVGTNVFGFALEASRRLETDGTVAFSTGNSTYVARSFELNSVLQAPRVSLSWSQPLFVNGSPFGTEAYRADRARSLDRPLRRADLALLETENAVVLAFAQNYGALRLAIAALDLKRARVALDERFRAVLAVRQSQGTITLSEVMEADVRVASERLEVIDLESKVRTLATVLAEATGLPESSFVGLEPFPQSAPFLPSIRPRIEIFPVCINPIDSGVRRYRIPRISRGGGSMRFDSFRGKGLKLFFFGIALVGLGSLTLAAQTSMVTPMVVVQDQAIDDSRVVILKVMSATPGWIVIHADNAGRPGPVIGYAAVREGENLNVVVAIDAKRATPVLYAMLHVDAGVIGSYEFPGADLPTMSMGAMVSPAFNASPQAY